MGVTAPDREIGEAVAVVVAVPRSTQESEIIIKNHENKTEKSFSPVGCAKSKIW